MPAIREFHIAIALFMTFAALVCLILLINCWLSCCALDRSGNSSEEQLERGEWIVYATAGEKERQSLARMLYEEEHHNYNECVKRLLERQESAERSKQEERAELEALLKEDHRLLRREAGGPNKSTTPSHQPGRDKTGTATQRTPLSPVSLLYHPSSSSAGNSTQAHVTRSNMKVVRASQPSVSSTQSLSTPISSTSSAVARNNVRPPTSRAHKMNATMPFQQNHHYPPPLQVRLTRLKDELARLGVDHEVQMVVRTN